MIRIAMEAAKGGLIAAVGKLRRHAFDLAAEKEADLWARARTSIGIIRVFFLKKVFLDFTYFFFSFYLLVYLLFSILPTFFFTYS